MVTENLEHSARDHMEKRIKNKMRRNKRFQYNLNQSLHSISEDLDTLQTIKYEIDRMPLTTRGDVYAETGM